MNPVPPRKILAVPAFTEDELRRCVEILESLVENRGLLAEVSPEIRTALLTAAGRASRPSSKEERKLTRTFRRAARTKKRTLDRQILSETEIRVARQAPVFVAPDSKLNALPAPAQDEGPELQRPRNCYVCKAEYRRLHFFYDSMCRECGDFNYAKRFENTRLDGRVALITGARVKIGFQAALKMLRAGAQVIVTTRFPHDAAERYSREADFAEFKDRLQIHGLDLRHAPSVEIFTRYLNHSLGRLDILINNAAQTVRRPPGFYAHLVEKECVVYSGLPREIRPLLAGHESCKAALSGSRSEGAAEIVGQPWWGSQKSDSNLSVQTDPGNTARNAGIGIRASAKLSQIPYAFDEEECREVFPVGQVDADLQQVDLRTQNSWRMALADVPAAEMLEVQLVNAVAPFILCSKLKGLMLKHPTGEKHIVNVSAMEGIFSRGTKTDKHPHTNMAKAALNMLTLTSARDYATDGIFMNAVDTGWVSDEDPAAHAARKREELDFEPPLDIVDGAARICDPFISGLISGTHVWGKFLKDYKVSTW